MPAYATASDYATFLGIADTYDATERLRIDAGLLNAQEDIDAVARFASYDPTSATVTAALTRATCARFRYLEETGDETGASRQWQTMRAGSVTLSRSDRDGAEAAASDLTLDARTARILMNAGLVGGIVRQW